MSDTKAKKLQLVQPGGPQGPFWGLMQAPEGYVIATQISDKKHAELFASAEILRAALEAVAQNLENAPDVGISHESAIRDAVTIRVILGEIGS